MLRGTWRFARTCVGQVAPRGSIIIMRAINPSSDSPQRHYFVRRHRRTWGWVLESPWHIMASFPLPAVRAVLASFPLPAVRFAGPQIQALANEEMDDAELRDDAGASALQLRAARVEYGRRQRWGPRWGHY